MIDNIIETAEYAIKVYYVASTIMCKTLCSNLTITAVDTHIDINTVLIGKVQM